MAGITNSVNMVENIKPPITAIPIETRLSDPAPSASAIGRTPRTVDKLVIKIGLKRAFAAPTIESLILIPVALRWLANSTIRIPFLDTNPMSIIIPIWLKIFSVSPKYHKENNVPAKAKGTVNIMINGSRKLSNWAERTR